MNQVTLMGRITKDIECSQSSNGKNYCKFTLAVKRPLKTDETDFINCVAFGKTAELIAVYFSKGDRILITGQINVNNHENQFYTNVVVNNFEFIETNKTRESKESTSTDKHLEPVEDYEDDIDFPF